MVDAPQPHMGGDNGDTTGKREVEHVDPFEARIGVDTVLAANVDRQGNAPLFSFS